MQTEDKRTKGEGGGLSSHDSEEPAVRKCDEEDKLAEAKTKQTKPDTKQLHPEDK